MEILKHPNSLLITKCPDYDYTTFIQDLLDAVKMAKLVEADKKCAGLAANQVGIIRRFFVMRDGLARIRYCFDPKILSHGRELEFASEGCMSLPDTFVSVPRWKVITVSYVCEKSKLVKITLKGKDARVFQHELDHLNGLLIIKTENDDV